RVAPLLDDKILTSWNGLMIGAMAEGYRVLGERRYFNSARRAAEYLFREMKRPDGGLYRTARGGRAHVEAFLDDYAYFADALVDLYEAGGNRGYLEEAARLAERLRADFREQRGGGFYQTAASGERLIVRNLEGHDGATPSEVAVAARLFARLAFHLDNSDYHAIAAESLRAHGAGMASMPRAFCTALSVADFLLEGPVEVVLVGKPGDPDYEALARELSRHPLPNRVIAHVNPAVAPVQTGLTAGRTLVGGKPAAYVCRSFVCKAPATSSGALAEALGEAHRIAADERATELAASRIEGRATPEGTEARARARAAKAGGGGYRPFGKTGLFASRIGFGGYRIVDGVPAHREALIAALRAGVDLIDTSTNYTDGGSERLVGQVIAELRRAGELEREGVIVVSKVGYAQGSALALARERKDSGFAYPEMLEIDDDLWHCIHPDWIEDQLDRSLDRLGLETIDALLLH
ncbi:MAG: aldo/keto reductase, partial [Polyangiaceae bacterium]|nr:aldo/keto reductase [Polyangiaceae bacterium]